MLWKSLRKFIKHLLKTSSVLIKYFTCVVTYTGYNPLSKYIKLVKINFLLLNHYADVWFCKSTV